MAQSIDQLRWREWYGEAAAALSIFVPLALLLGGAALSGLLLGIVL